MALAQDVLVTVDDYRLFPETGQRYQVVEGQLIMAPAPNRYHQEISLNIEFIICKFLEKHPIGKVYHAPFDVYLDKHNVFQPDVIFVANDRFSILTDAGAEGAPNLVIEILSLRTERLDKEPKRKVYAREGVEEYWLVNPLNETIEVFLLQKNPGGPGTRHGGRASFASVCLPGLTFRCREIFAR